MSWQELISHSIKDAQLSVINDYNKNNKDDVLVDYSLKSSRVWCLVQNVNTGLTSIELFIFEKERFAGVVRYQHYSKLDGHTDYDCPDKIYNNANYFLECLIWAVERNKCKTTKLVSANRMKSFMKGNKVIFNNEVFELSNRVGKGWSCKSAVTNGTMIITDKQLRKTTDL